jgi:hypothetical protein
MFVSNSEKKCVVICSTFFFDSSHHYFKLAHDGQIYNKGKKKITSLHSVKYLLFSCNVETIYDIEVLKIQSPQLM